MYVFAREPFAAMIAVTAAAGFLATVVGAWDRARALDEPVRLPAEGRTLQSNALARVRNLVVVSCAPLALLFLREVRTWSSHHGGDVAASVDAFAIGAPFAEIPIVGGAALVFGLSAIALFVAAVRASRLPSGTLEDDVEGPRVCVGATTYRLESVPEGILPGEPLLFLAQPVAEGGVGPYRTGLCTILAPRVWRGESRALARHLARRARRHAMWALAATATLAVLV